MTYHYKYWSAFNEADLLQAGDHSLTTGDTFVMPGAATVTLAAYDNDGQLSGDSNGRATDNEGHYDQFGYANSGNGWEKTGDLYVDTVFTLHGSDGRTYYLAEIEGENRAESEDYFSFVGATPPAGVTLTIGEQNNSHGVNYSDLSADPSEAPANTGPVFDNMPDNGVIHLDENKAQVKDINASDADGDTLTYSIVGGADANAFTINASTGNLRFKDAPDFENPTDQGHDNVYDVTVQVSDGNGGTVTKTLWVKIQDVDENVNTAPVFDNLPGNGVLHIDENRTMVIDVNASDVDNDNLTFAITGGADAHAFTIDAHTGQLKFNSAPDFENPQDVNGDNAYDVTITVTDGNGGTTTKPLWVKVKDVEETVAPGWIKGRFSHDADGNDNEWNDETNAWDEGISGATIQLIDLKGMVVATTTTDAHGNYNFDVAPGDYRVKFPAQDGKEFSAQNSGVAEHFDSDADANGLTEVISVTSGSTVMDIDAGVKAVDVQDDVEMECIIVEAEDMHLNGMSIRHGSQASDGELVRTSHLGGEGDLTTTFNGQGGTYDLSIFAQDENDGQSSIMVKVNGVLVEAFALDRETDGRGSDNSGFTEFVIEGVELSAGDEVMIWVDGDAGEWARIDKIKFQQVEEQAPQTGSLGGTYFMDNNDNSVQDNGDMAIAGATVWLLENGAVIASTTTDANGNYLFDDLAAGDYAVRFDEQNDKSFVDGNVGNNDAIDSDVINVGSAGNGNTATVTVGAGEDVRNVDAGVETIVAETSSVSGRYFCDENDDSLDNGEPAVANKWVGLFDADWNLVASTSTDANGDYEFTGLDAGQYRVVFEGDEKSFVDANAGDDTIDSDVIAVNGTDGTGRTDLFDLAAGEHKDNVDAGIEVVDAGDAQISGRISFDADDDDTENAAGGGFDAGLGGKIVELLDENGDVIATTTTAANGSYAFTGLDAGTYSVNFPDTMGLQIADQDVGAEGEDSDADQNGQTAPIVVGIGDNIPDIDISLQDPDTAAINGRLFMDNNDNDQDDAGDMGIAGVEVELLDENGDVIATTTTNGNGEYSFNGLGAGDYAVRFPEEVDGKVLVEQNVGPNATDSDADQNTGETGTISLDVGEVSNDNDAGVEDPAGSVITGRVFMDNNDNSQDDAGDMGVAGVPVQLLDEDGNVVGNTTTGANGSYSFTGLEAGTYSVNFPTEVDGKVLVDANVGPDGTDSDADEGTGNTGPITVGIGETSSNNDAGVEDPGTASIGNLVFLDNNGDGRFNTGDERVAGVTVELLDENGDVIDSTTTNGNGQYRFDDLDAGIYSVKFTAPDGTEFTTEGTSADDARNNDSDADLVSGETDQVELSIGEAERDIDAGLIVSDTGDAAIEGRVFMDNNDNSQDDAGDMGVAGVPVDLLDENGDVIDSTTTGADGSYAFTGLAAGTYSVTFPTEVDGKVLVDANVGPDGTDSDADEGTGNTGPITVGIGETSSNNDAGVEDPGTASLAGIVFMDNNDNSQADAGDMAIGGVTVELLDENGDVIDSATTGADGSYEFNGLDAGSYSVRFPTTVDGKVLVDSNVGPDSSDSDANQLNGETPVVELGIGERSDFNDAGFEDPAGSAITGRVFMDNNDNSQDDAGDMGVAGVPVQLLDENGNVIGNTTTGPNGSYAFTGLAAGTYSVTFPTEVDGKVLVDSNVGPDGTDSDADQGTGNTGPITVGINETSNNNDAGVEDPGTAAIGDRVFLDENGNGQQDAGEQGVGGVDVIVRDANGNIAGTDTTDANGDYLVDGLDAGTYTVEFEEVDGFDFTTANSGNDATDSDADQTTGVSGAVTLEIGETDLTVDAGLVAENEAPVAGDDEGMVCATEAVSINVLANDADADGDAISVAHVNGEDIAVGGSVTLDSGATVTLLANGELSYDSSTAVINGVPADEIVQNETATDSFTYSITDGNGGTDTGEVNVTLKGDMDTIETILESAPTSGKATFSGFTQGEAYTATISGTGDARYDGLTIAAAYCLEYDADFVSGVEAMVDISGALDSLTNPGDFINDTSGNLDLINWLINQDFTSVDNGDGTGTNYTDAEVQAAIWGITDDSAIIFESPTNGTIANALELQALAEANGEGYVPGEGDLFTLILNPTEVQPGVSEADDFDQAFIVALPFDEFKEDCIC